MIDYANIPFVQAKWFTVASRSKRDIQYIVMHTMEAPEKGNTAESVAQYFASAIGERKASAHYCVDANSIVQCVQCKDVAYAVPGANHNGIHIELAGYAAQSAADWSDQFSDAMLRLAGELCGRVLCPKFEIPIIYVGSLLLARAAKSGGMQLRGFTSHNDVSRAFKRSTHTDPGPGFPFQKFLGYVRDCVPR